MSDDLHRIVYYSRNKIEGGPAALALAIDDIMAASQRNNRAAHVTGALMFNAGCFGQVLEGRPEDLETTFERIQRDARHGEVSLLAFEPIRSRIFGHWSMGFVGRRPDHESGFEAVATRSGFDPERISGHGLLEALRRLAIEEEATAL